MYKIIHSVKVIKHHEISRQAPDKEDLVQDPLCHTYVPVTQAYAKEINGKTLYFCSKECCDQYESK